MIFHCFLVVILKILKIFLCLTLISRIFDFSILEISIAALELKSMCNPKNIRRKEANISISKHPQLLEILELPQLIDTSIRNSYFEEGLELHSFVNNLAVKYTDISIIQVNFYLFI